MEQAKIEKAKIAGAKVKVKIALAQASKAKAIQLFHPSLIQQCNHP
ncbi:MAG: hypothetical protein GX091_05480 [Peptococcaceae bacterium]|nr:hypothetical protein [Peptococcaceae bacterium]